MANNYSKPSRIWAERGPDYSQLLEELIHLLHQFAVFKIVPTAVSLEDELQQMAQQMQSEDIQLYYQIALLGRRDLVYMPAPQQGFEMIMLRMLAFKPQTKESISPKVVTPIEIKSTPSSKPFAPAMESTVETAAPPTIDWHKTLPHLKLSGLSLALASNCSLTKMNGNHIQLTLGTQHQPMLNAKLKDRIAEALSQYLKQPIALEIKTTNEELLTPVKQHLHEKQQLLTDAKQKILQDPNVKKMIEIYDATVEVSLIG